MNEGQGYFTSLSQLGVAVNNDAKIDYLRNNMTTYLSASRISFSLQEIYNYCSYIGFDINALQDYQFSNKTGKKFYNVNAIIQILNSYIEFDQLVVSLCYFANSNIPNEYRKNINSIIVNSVNDCNVDIKVKCVDDELTAYRKGAETLDNPLIFELLSWLPAYKPVLKSFETALQQYTNKQFERNCVDNLRHALEMLIKQRLNSAKSLENLKSDIGQFLKNNGVPVHISNMFETLLTYYTNYQNNYVKHDDKVDQREIEFILYLTGTFMRFIITADQQRQVTP